MFETIYQLRTATDEMYRGRLIPRGHVICRGKTLDDTVAKRDEWERTASAELRRPVTAEVWANECRVKGTTRRFVWSCVA